MQQIVFSYLLFAIYLGNLETTVYIKISRLPLKSMSFRREKYDK